MHLSVRCPMTKQYDQAYFQHWYRRSDIGGPQRLARKVALAVACAEYYLERPIRTVLDIGCGEGAWRAPLLKLRPKLRYLGFDSSEFAVSKYGPRRNLHYAHFGDFAQLRPCPPVDLLICADVLHYLPIARTAARPAGAGGTLRRRCVSGDFRARGRVRGRPCRLPGPRRPLGTANSSAPMACTRSDRIAGCPRPLR